MDAQVGDGLIGSVIDPAGGLWMDEMPRSERRLPIDAKRRRSWIASR
jgi:hypothetical protein